MVPFLRLSITVCLAAVSLSFSQSAGGQPGPELVGRVFERDLRTPVSGAIVSVLAADNSKLIAATLTSEAGNFSFKMPGPGSYRIRAERIGYESVTVAVKSEASGEFNPIRIVLGTRAAVLQTVTIAAKPGCVGAGVRDSLADAVWREAAKALIATVLAGADRAPPAAVRRFTAEETSDAKHTIATHTFVVTGPEARAYAAIPATELSADGYLRITGREQTYFAPDAATLVSDEFLRSHCLAVSKVENSAASEIGLTFEPRGRASGVDIRGVMWVDRSSAELRRVEYGYVGLPWNVPSDNKAGGEIVFERAASGKWFVRRWMIRMPALSVTEMTRWGLAVPSVTRIEGYRQEGAEILDNVPSTDLSGASLESPRVGQSADMTRPLVPTSPRKATARCPGLLDGTVADGMGRGVPKAEVILSWSSISSVGTVLQERQISERVTTASDGSFLVCGLPTDRKISIALDGANSRVPITTGLYLDTLSTPVRVLWPDRRTKPRSADTDSVSKLRNRR